MIKIKLFINHIEIEAKYKLVNMIKNKKEGKFNTPHEYIKMVVLNIINHAFLEIKFNLIFFINSLRYFF